MILMTGHKGFVGQYGLKALPGAIGCDLPEHDICDEAALRNIFESQKIDTVIHMAARTGVRTGAKEPDAYVRTNIIGTRLLLALAEAYGVRHFIHFSSSSVYGNQHPPNAEDAPMTPGSVYGITKAASEMLCRISPVPTTVIRPFTLYGKNGRKDQVVYTWLNQYKAGKPLTFFGDGTMKRGYTHAEDVIDGLLLILKKGPPVSGHEVYNLGGAEVVTLAELRKIFERELPGVQFEELPKPDSDVFENWANIEKAERELGWTPKRNFETEMQGIIQEFLNKHT